MLPELSEIKKRRKRFGFTQSGLAAKTDVSQSLIAKIESDAIVPSYNNAKRLFDFFDSLHEETQARARDFMSQKVISVSPSATIKEAVRVMKKNAVSQLPVIEGGRNFPVEGPSGRTRSKYVFLFPRNSGGTEPS